MAVGAVRVVVVVTMPMIVGVVMIVVVVVTAAAGVAVVVIMFRLVGVRAGDVQVVVRALAVIVAVVMAVPMSVRVAVALVGAAFGLEGAGDAGGGAAETPDHLGEHVIVLDVDGVGGDLGRGVAVANVPGDLGEPGRSFRADLDQRLGGGGHLDQAAIFKAEGVAALGGGGLVEIEQEFEAAVGFQRHAPAVAALVVEGDRVDDPLGLDGELANDGGGADHQELRASDGWTLPRPGQDRKTTFRLGRTAFQGPAGRATRATRTMAASEARPEKTARVSATLSPASRAAAKTTGARPKAMFWASISRPLALP
jgi:hypothetical protein